jgi:hypothetical protein
VKACNQVEHLDDARVVARDDLCRCVLGGIRRVYFEKPFGISRGDSRGEARCGLFPVSISVPILLACCMVPVPVSLMPVCLSFVLVPCTCSVSLCPVSGSPLPFLETVIN